MIRIPGSWMIATIVLALAAGAAISTSGDYEQTMLQVAPEHVDRGQSAGFTDTNIDIANVVMDYSFGWANLVATYSNTQSGSATAVPDQLFGQNWPLSFHPIGDHALWIQTLSRG